MEIAAEAYEELQGFVLVGAGLEWKLKRADARVYCRILAVEYACRKPKIDHSYQNTDELTSSKPK